MSLQLVTPHELSPSAEARPRSERRRAGHLATTAVCIAVVAQPLVHPSGPGNSSAVDAFVLLALLATGLWAATSGMQLKAPYAVPVAVMVVAGALAGLVGPLPSSALLAVVQDLVLIAWCTAVVNVSRLPGALRLITRAWAVSSVCWAGILVAAWLLHVTPVLGRTVTEGNRVLFTFGDPNYAGTYWVCSIFVVYATHPFSARWLRRLGYALLITALLLTESNGAVLELVVGGAIVLLFNVARRRGLMAAVTLLVLIVTTGGVLSQTVSMTGIQTWARDSGQPFLVNSVGRSNDSSSQRGTLIGESLELYESDGLLGSGPATTKQLLFERQYPYAKEAHNDYLAALVERGPLGVTGMLLLVIGAIWRAATVLRLAYRRRLRTDLPRPEGIIAALAAMALAGTFYEVLHFRFVWILLALTATLSLAPPLPRPGAQPDHDEPKS